jgi:hypothetical protein
MVSSFLVLDAMGYLVWFIENDDTGYQKGSHKSIRWREARSVRVSFS